MAISAKDKRKIATASLQQIEDEQRSASERVLDNIGEVSDEFGWNWIQFDEDDEWTFRLERDRYTIFVKFDHHNGGIEDSKLEVALRSDADLFQAIREI